MNALRVISAVALTVLLVALSACGGDANEEYANQVKETRADISQALQGLSDELFSAPDSDASAEVLASARTELEDAATQLGELDVPAGAEQLNEDLVAAIEDFTAEVEATREAAASGSGQDFQTAATDLLAAASQFNEEFIEFQAAAEEAGIQIEPMTTAAEPTTEE